MDIAIMRLEAPFQSYEAAGYWDKRGTSLFPTKSAVIGMLGAAFGFEYGSKDLEDLCNALKMSVRVNKRGGLMTDFQMMHGYTVPHTSRKYNGDDPVEYIPYTTEVKKVLKANGKGEKILNRKHCVDKNAPVMTERGKVREKTYLVDCSFTVFLQGMYELLKDICDATRHPVYPLFCGRRNCPPSIPIIATITGETDIVKAWSTCDVLSPGRCVIEYEEGVADVEYTEKLTRKDNVTANYIYIPRYLYRKEIETCF